MQALAAICPQEDISCSVAMCLVTDQLPSAFAAVSLHLSLRCVDRKFRWCMPGFFSRKITVIAQRDSAQHPTSLSASSPDPIQALLIAARILLPNTFTQAPFYTPTQACLGLHPVPAAKLQSTSFHRPGYPCHSLRSAIRSLKMTTLNVKTGPMLRYDNVDLAQSVWHGYAMIVTEDATSDYQITLPSSIDGRMLPIASPAADGSTAVSDENSHKTSEAIKLYQYHGKEGSSTFWRFKIQVPLADHEQASTTRSMARRNPNSQSEAIKA